MHRLKSEFFTNLNVCLYIASIYSKGKMLMFCFPGNIMAPLHELMDKDIQKSYQKWQDPCKAESAAM